MTSLLDIGDLHRTVSIRGKEVDCPGISADSFVVLLDRFPEIRKAMSDKSWEAFNPTELIKMAPRIVHGVIAAGLGHAGDEKAEKMVKSLTIGEQLPALKQIFEVTFPFGVVRFADDLAALGSAAMGQDNLLSLSSGKASDTKSPPLSNGADATVTQKPAATPRAN